MIGYGYYWLEVTTLQELADGKRTFVRGYPVENSAVAIGPEAVDAFERFGTDGYAQVVDTKAGLIAALKRLGIPVKE